jgi:ribA/ribD-fused uncharacterized protein
MPSPTSRSSADGLRAYNRSRVVVVFKTTETFGGLSNMAAGYPVVVNGVRILTIEALYQACRFPHLPSLQREIIGQHSPMTAKMKSKAYSGESRSDWNDVRYKIMRWCLRVKLAQHYKEFGELLLSTEDKTIVEQSRKDSYWGAKLAEDQRTLVGQNVLGRLLMELRERLKNDNEGKLRSVPPVRIRDFCLLGKPLEVVTDLQVPAASEGHQSEMF